MHTRCNYLFILAPLAIVSVLSSIAIAAFGGFKDVGDNHKNYDAIVYVAEKGIVGGYDDGTYRPDNTINRAEFTKIISESAHPGKASGTNCFPDIKTEWFAKYVCFAKTRGYIGGYQDGTFKPSNKISFVEAAKIITKGFNLPSEDDGSGIWYKQYVEILSEYQAIPASITKFTQNITRGEMAEMIHRIKEGNSGKSFQTYETLQKGTGPISQNTSTPTATPEPNPNPGLVPAQYTDYSLATIDTALKMDKVILFFHAKWCPTCKTVDAEITQKIKTLPGEIHIIRVDYDTERALNVKYGVTYQHTFVHVDKDGKLVKKWSGGDLERLKKEMGIVEG